ncbi:DUF3263 domain-containing protein [Agrococcus sp. SL85]|uniref:DUF3263 domain-containing protein n=1 Tax=Agrococcus sp. SL85 TaxID=2995141 RepID=UPI00226CC678|nr:DUF3263 domain-containing protein [Agrococcus sp. SL85]WAC66541.1 DUF3263 domain-containing protein [Agrococcus sp. SL85]
MPNEPRAHGGGSADEAAALAFAEGAALEDAQIAQADDDVAAAREARVRRILDFEGRWSSHAGAKARAIRAEFGWSTTRYYQVLDGLLATPEAVRHDPMLVRRLLRLREGR